VPRVIVTLGAAEGLERCRLFLNEKNPRAARRAGQTILQQFTLLETNPDIGRPLDDLAELQELVIPFGESGYVSLYRHDLETNTVYILAFRHQKEAGYYY
jgi:plasmid stabilization system protein ParE